MELKQQIPVKTQGKVNSVTITMNDRNSPTYEFTGEWGGRDIKVIQRTLIRAYNIKVRSSRRRLSELSDIKPVALSAKG
jgi:hypothetical protein